MTNLTFFSSPIGLGHATRDSAIGCNLHNIERKFISGKAAAGFFLDNGFDVSDVYVPPSFDVKNGELQGSLKWLWKYYKYYKDCKKIASNIIRKEQPKLIVSDEDFASLSIAQGKKIPTVLITDILETRFTKGFGSIIERKMNKSMKELIRKSDVVILPENGRDEDNIKRVGPIVRETKFSRDELRQKFSFNKKTIVVSIGGTNAGKFLIQKVLDIRSKIDYDIELVLVSGPSLHKNFDKNVKNLGFVKDFHEVVYAADVLVSLAGKSTIDEAKAYGTPSIFIPIKDHFEQEDNAKDEGFSYDDIFRLDELISKKLSQKRNPIHCDGARKAAQIISNLL